jgi:hypothetical protein
MHVDDTTPININVNNDTTTIAIDPIVQSVLPVAMVVSADIERTMMTPPPPTTPCMLMMQHQSTLTTTTPTRKLVAIPNGI